LIGLGFVVLLAGAVAAMPRTGRPGTVKTEEVTVKTEEVMVGSAPGAVVTRFDPTSITDYPPCDVTPSTGAATILYRVVPTQDWTKTILPLCHPPGFRPGAVSLTFGTQLGIHFGAVIPLGGWVPYQRWQGNDAQINFRLTADSVWWMAWDKDLPCRIGTETLRRFMTPIKAFEGEPLPDGRVQVGAQVRASFDCVGLPLFKIPGAAPVDLKGELMVRNCEATARVLPPPALPPGCPEA
jgi:hypothetical protein